MFHASDPDQACGIPFTSKQDAAAAAGARRAKAGGRWRVVGCPICMHFHVIRSSTTPQRQSKLERQARERARKQWAA